MTVPNQPNSITRRITKPTPTIHGPAPTPLNQNAAPIPMSSSATDPVIGQCDGCGM